MNKSLMYHPNAVEEALIAENGAAGQRDEFARWDTHDSLRFHLGGDEYIVVMGQRGPRNGVRGTIVGVRADDESKWRWGFREGHRLPVAYIADWEPCPGLMGRETSRGNGRERSGRRGNHENDALPLPNLVLTVQLDGFRESEATRPTHRDGWYSNSIVARRVAPPENLAIWGEGADYWSLREGVYITFPDGTFRLVPNEEIFGLIPKPGSLSRLFCTPWAARFGRQEINENGDTISIVSAVLRTTPAARQGDCLVFSVHDAPTGTSCTDRVLDRHAIVGGMITAPSAPGRALIVRGSFRLEHPEHAPVEVSQADGEAVLVTLAPGTSRPFARTGGSD